jgi:putative alpha-1,2-mannosidase
MLLTCAIAAVLAAVDPLIGTDYVGNVYPGAQTPFGMVQLSPDNGLPGWDRIAGYFYPDSTIASLSHTHLSGTGAGDLYDIAFLPAVTPLRRAPEPLGVYSRFSHESEQASPGYYRVTLSDYDVDVELTATDRAGVQRYVFHRPDSAVVILNLRRALNWDALTSAKIIPIDSVTIVGHRHSTGWARDQRLWFATRFSRPYSACALDSLGQVALLQFPGVDTLEVTTTLSPVATPEPVGIPFDEALSAARAAWGSALSCIDVEGGTRADSINFYTALYRAQLAPTLYGDDSGLYRGNDGRIHHCAQPNYSTFSLWDTYRAAHPLYALLWPQRAADMVESLLNMAEQQGRLPVWPMQGSETDMMIGYHAASVIAEACLKGVYHDCRRALQACVSGATADSYRSIGEYRRLGYVACDTTTWAVSRTLEYAYDDGCIARLAAAIGADSIAAEFTRRSHSWRNLYNPRSGFFEPRRHDGSFLPDFNPDLYTVHFCESNAWPYLWAPQHDVDSLIATLGGPDATLSRLNAMFTHRTDSAATLPIFSTGMIGQYVHGNEPSHHVAYLFNRVGRHDLTAAYVHRILTEMYRPTPDGLCGNEDCGQMSAWFVWSALGLYPLDPCSLTYELGVPLFQRATIHLPSGRDFTIEAAAPGDPITLNGAPLSSPQITHAQLLSGGLLRLPTP